MPRLPSLRHGLPLGRDPSLPFLPWIVALLACVASLAGIGLVVVSDTAGEAARSVAGTATVLLPADISEARSQTVMALLRQTPGIASAEPVPPSETARLLEPWLGSPLPFAELPVPRLIDLHLNPGHGGDLAEMRRRLTEIVGDARFDDHSAWLAAVRAAVHPLEGLLAILIAAALGVIGVAAALAARAAALVRRPVIELFLLLGASDSAITWPLAVPLAGACLLGGVIGEVAALLAVAAASRSDALGHLLAIPVAAIGLGDWRLWAIAAAAPIAAGMAGFAGAWTVAGRVPARIA